jgi:hypothetical protein
MSHKTSLSYRSSPPCAWIEPRPHQDASARYRKHGPVRGMDDKEPWWRRLLRCEASR